MSKRGRVLARLRGDKSVDVSAEDAIEVLTSGDDEDTFAVLLACLPGPAGETREQAWQRLMVGATVRP